MLNKQITCLLLVLLLTLPGCAQRSEGNASIIDNHATSLNGDVSESRRDTEQSIETDPAESENHQADSENPLDDVLNKTFIDSHDNMALADDGILYMLSDDEGAGQLTWAVIADNVKTINKQLHSGATPFYQTNDNKFYGYDYNSGGYVEYKHDFTRPYLLLGGNMLLDEATGEVFRADWSESRVTAEAELRRVILAVDAVDLPFYADGKQEFYAILLTNDGTLYVYSTITGSMKEIAYNVTKFYAGETDKIGGAGHGVWYLTNDRTLHILYGFDWDIEKVPHYQFGYVLDFWRSNSSEILALYDNNEVRIIGPSMESIPYAEAPNGGISNVLSIWIHPPAHLNDGPSLPRAEYLMIDQNGRIVADNWTEHPYEE